MNAQQETQRRHLAFVSRTVAILALVLTLVAAFWSAYIPYGPFELWVPKAGPLTWIAVALPGIAWGMTLQGALELLRSTRMTKLDVFNFPKPTLILSDGTKISVTAGILEEIGFRWLLFLLCLFGYAVLNLPFLALGINLDVLAHGLFLTPIANLMTLGALKDVLYHDAGWHVGAAMLTANAFFRDGHKYQGPLGWTNSWFMGMYFFWAMLRFGLPAAIVAHALYDVAVFGTVAFAASARLRGWLSVRG